VLYVPCHCAVRFDKSEISACIYVYMWVSSVHAVLWEDLKARDHLADLVKAGRGRPGGVC